MEWIEIPNSLGDNYPNKIGWYEGSILLKYSDENITTRVENADIESFQEIKNAINNERLSVIQIKLLSLFKKSDQITQLGSRVNLDDVPEQFEWSCPNCSDTKFQMRGKYGGKYAVCISCNQRLSVIIDICKCCNKKSLFVKESANLNSWYECFNCSANLD
jgi:hypothetical protein